MLEEVKAVLADVGLSAKEASVYIALLQLGSVSAQKIASHAGVNRSTTYLAIDALKRRGLVSAVERDGKTEFIAEDPRRVMALTVDELARLEERKDKIKRVMPQLSAIFQSASDRPRVRFFDGEESLHHAREEMIATRAPIWEVYAADERTVKIASIRQKERIDMAKRRLSRRLLVAVKPGCRLAPFSPDGVEVRVMDYDACPFSGSVTVAGDKLCIFTPETSGMGILVDSREIAQVFRALYEAAWSCSKKASFSKNPTEK